MKKAWVVVRKEVAFEQSILDKKDGGVTINDGRNKK